MFCRGSCESQKLYVLSWFVCVADAVCFVVVRVNRRSCMFCRGSYV